MKPEDFAAHYLERMERATTIQELDLLAIEIREWRDFLAITYQSNKMRLLNTGSPEDILKKRI